MIAGIVVAVVVLLALALVVAIARDPGPGPIEVALAYEAAADRRDFDTLYRLSGPELHGGARRVDFVRAREAEQGAASAGPLVAEVRADAVDQRGDRATVVTVLALRGGGVVRNEVELARRDRVWQVVARRLEPAA